jgi:hypothetical protein
MRWREEIGPNRKLPGQRIRRIGTITIGEDKGRSSMQLHLKTVNDELKRRGHFAELAKASGYFYFDGGEAVDWLDRSVGVRTINSLTLKQWMEEFERLKKLNAQIIGTLKRGEKKSTT